MSQVQPNNPLHGITLEVMLTALLARYGWSGLAERIPLNCFSHDPSVKSSLTFLRKTGWAKQKVERLYLASERLQAEEEGDEVSAAPKMSGTLAKPAGLRSRPKASPRDDQRPRKPRAEGDRPARRFDRDGERPARRFEQDGERPARRFEQDGERRGPRPQGERPARRFEQNGERPARRFEQDGERRGPRPQGEQSARRFEQGRERPARRFEQDGERPARRFEQDGERRSPRPQGERPARRFEQDGERRQPKPHRKGNGAPRAEGAQAAGGSSPWGRGKAAGKAEE